MKKALRILFFIITGLWGWPIGMVIHYSALFLIFINHYNKIAWVLLVSCLTVGLIAFIKSRIKRGKEYDDNKIIVLVGYNGSGKTTITRDIISQLRTNNPDSILWKWDLSKEFYDFNNVKNLNQLDWYSDLSHPTINNDIILLNDFQTLYEGTLTEDINYAFLEPSSESFFSKLRKRGNTIIITVHSVNSIPYCLRGHISKYYFFRTQVEDKIFSRHLEFPELCAAACKMVNSYSDKYADIINHPKHSKYCGQSFPYVIVDLKRPEVSITFSNMDKLSH